MSGIKSIVRLCHIAWPGFLLLLLISIFASTACKNNTQETEHNLRNHIVKDKEAYNLGETHARELTLIAADEDAVQESLLEIRAFSQNIRTKVSEQTALDYEKGVLDYLHANCDSLAKIID